MSRWVEPSRLKPRSLEASQAREIKRLRISQLGAVEGSKLRAIHDLSFSPACDWMSVNHLTDHEKAPRLGLGHILRHVLTPIMSLRQRFGPSAHIVLSKADVKDAFRQIRVNPASAPVFGFKLGEIVVVDLDCSLVGGIVPVSGG